MSAGILAYRKGAHGLEVLLVHPGGPFWRNKDSGAWSIPKGEIDAPDDPEQVARREFAEELGPGAAIGRLRELGEIRQRGGKRVIAFAGEGHFDPAALTSNTFDIEWPPRSGRRQSFPKSTAPNGSISRPHGRSCYPARWSFSIDFWRSWVERRKMMFRIGIISDTHGLLRPEAERRLAGVDHIVHAGDIGRPEIVDALRRIAPVTAIRGNVDNGEWAREYPDTTLVRLAGKSIYVLHDLKTLQADPGAGIDVIVSGHSHIPKIETVRGVLYLNPGSAGRRRFKLPITLATLEVTPEGLRPEIHDLEGG